MYRKGFDYTVSAMFVPLILTPRNAEHEADPPDDHVHISTDREVMEMGSYHAVPCCTQANKPCPVL